LSGMKWKGPSPSNSKINLVRPLLDQPKAVLLDYAAANKIRFREDATNASLDIQRNRIRHELLPLLRRKYQPALDKTVLRVMDIVGTEAELVSDVAAGWLEVRRREVCGGRSIEKFAHLPVALQRRLIQLQSLGYGIAADF